jgi:hypothetical protein
LQTYFIDGCGSLRIEYKLKNDDIWRELLVSTPSGTPLTNYLYFDSRSPNWPEALRFTIRLYDRDLMIKSPDPDQTNPANQREHGGLTFKFVVPIPD